MNSKRLFGHMMEFIFLLSRQASLGTYHTSDTIIMFFLTLEYAICRTCSNWWRVRKRREEIWQKEPLKDWKSLLLPSG